MLARALCRWCLPSARSTLCFLLILCFFLADTKRVPHGAATCSTFRYSDFVWLQERFLSKYAAVILPPLPAKKLVGNLDAQFVETRRQALEFYLNRIGEHSLLRTSLEFCVFISSTPRVSKQAARGQLPFVAVRLIVTCNSWRNTQGQHVRSFFHVGYGCPPQVLRSSEDHFMV